MNNSKKILISSLISVFMFVACDTNNGKTEQETEDNKEAKINKSQEDARLLVLASKNYINLINYSNYIILKTSLSPTIKKFISTFKVNTKDRLSNLKNLSRDELVLLPNEFQNSISDDESFNENETDLNQKTYLKKLTKLIDNQISLMDELSEKSNKLTITILANEAEDFFKEEKINIENIIQKAE